MSCGGGGSVCVFGGRGGGGGGGLLIGLDIPRWGHGKTTSCSHNDVPSVVACTQKR